MTMIIPMIVTLVGMSMVVRAEQSLKAQSPYIVMMNDDDDDDRDTIIMMMMIPIEVTLVGIVTDVSKEHEMNALETDVSDYIVSNNDREIIMIFEWLPILVTDEEKIISHGDDEHLLQQPVPPLTVHTLVLAVQPPAGQTNWSILTPTPSQKNPVPQLATVHDDRDVPNPAATQVPTGHAVLIPPVQ